jgi:ATP-dependent RNA helicase DeaD
MPKTRAEAPPADFSSLGLADTLVAAATALGYEEATPIQREAIPVLLGGKDVLGQAATGTGKTAAFALPLLQRITEEGVPRGRTNALILVPTRELAMQVAEAIHKYSRGLDLSVVPLYGGAAMDLQIRALKRGADVVVATPGRALDHLQRRTLKLDQVRVLVLDEADEMLDMGFAEDIEALLNATPPQRQTALFAATMPPRIAAIAERHLREPVRVTIEREKVAAGAVPRVRQVAFLVTRAHKPLALGRVLDMESPTSAIVFCRTRLEVDGLVENLNAHGYRAEALHGGMVQKQRDRVMAQFRAAKTDLLVATDVAARGLDIAHLSHVFNYDVPSSPEVYVHRIGRTGRVGRAGVAITLAEPREHRQLRNIEAFTRQKIEVTAVPTVADLRSRRLDVTRAALRERLLAGGSEDVRVVVESLAEEFDLVEIASAAVKMALVLEEGEGGRSEEEIPVVSLKSDAARPEGRKGPHPRDAKGPRPAHDTRKMAPGVSKAGGKTTRLFIAAGRQAGVRPADLVGAIAGEAGVGSHVIGSIEIGDRFSIVEVPTALATRILFALRATKIRGRKVTVNRDRGERA